MAIRPSTISRFRASTRFMSVAVGPVTMPKRSAWRTRSATFALQISFLLGRQLVFGQEPPINLRSTRAVRCPDLAMCQARNLPPSPLPRTSISKGSGCDILHSSSFLVPPRKRPRSRCASGRRSPLVYRRRHRPRRRGAGEPISGGAGWLHRLELLTDDRRDPGTGQERDMSAARHLDVLEMRSPATLQAARRRRAERVPLRIDRRQPYTVGEAVVGEVA